MKLKKFSSTFAPQASVGYYSAAELTLFENENEWQKTEPVPTELPKAYRNVPNVKTRNEKKNP